MHCSRRWGAERAQFETLTPPSVTLPTMSRRGAVVAPCVVREGRRYRWVMDNQSADDHPVHLHRHTFDVVRVADRRIGGIRKDVVVVPAWKQVEVDVDAVHPGLSLFPCHQQVHMDMGFMTMMRYGP